VTFELGGCGAAGVGWMGAASGVSLRDLDKRLGQVELVEVERGADLGLIRLDASGAARRGLMD
jgi:hypothetical protein